MGETRAAFRRRARRYQQVVVWVQPAGRWLSRASEFCRKRRAMVEMASASGNSVPTIANLVQTSEDRVREMIHRINDKGMSSLDPQWVMLTRALQAHLRWRNAYARHPDLLATERRERARVRAEKGQRWGRPATRAA